MMVAASEPKKIVEAGFESRERLAEALIQDLEEGGIFVAGEQALSAGEAIQVLVRIEGIEPGILMRGNVLWRRIARGPRIPAGIGVQFAASEVARFHFLRDLAIGEGAAQGRLGRRYPVSIPIAFVLANDTAIRAGTLIDISDAGALLHATPAPAVDQIVVVRLRDGRSGPPIPLRVVWSQKDAAGLGVLTDRTDVRRFWDRVVASARADVDARLVRPGGTGM